MRRPEVGIIALAMLASACAFPTESPNWDMTWNLPMPDNNAMSIGVSTFLPSGVDTVTPTGSTTLAFRAKISSNPAINRTLGVQCPACPTATAKKPKFQATPATTAVTLDASTSLSSGTLTSGSQLVVTLTNGFTFDPLNPPGGAGGPTSSMTLTVTNGSATLGSLLLGGLGTTTAGVIATTIPAGTSKQFTIPLSGTFNTSQGISIGMTMDSDSGTTASPVAMNPNQPFTAVGVPTLNVSSATVAIAAQPITASATPLDLSQVDSTVIRRIVNDNQNRGTLYLTITNPLTIGAASTITFRSPTGSSPITPITKNVTIAPATSGTTPTTSTAAINLTGAELRSMFGRDIEAVFGGTTQAGTATVTPTQKIAISSRIQVNFTLKEQQP